MKDPTVGSGYLWTTDDGSGNGIRNGNSVWDGSGASSVSLVLTGPGPSFTTTVKAMTASDASKGVYTYQGDGSELTVPGPWKVAILVVTSGVSTKSKANTIHVTV